MRIPIVNVHLSRSDQEKLLLAGAGIIAAGLGLAMLSSYSFGGRGKVYMH